MATITVRGLDDEVQRRLKRRAGANNRSMEAEARAILSESVTDGFVAGWLRLCESHRGVELPEPTRSRPREVDLR